MKKMDPRKTKGALVAALVLAALAVQGSTLIEKRWTQHDDEAMMNIARERVARAMKEIGRPALVEAGRSLRWDDPSPGVWAPSVIEWVDKGFDLFPPGPENGRARRLLFEVLDVAIHLDYPPPLVDALDRMFHRRVDPAVDEIASTQEVEGARVWKIYNMGFVVMAGSRCFAFDLHPGKVVTPLSDRQIEKLAGRCEALFITHRHGDHWDKRLLDAFSRRGRPIVAPEGDFWDGPGLVVSRDARGRPLDVAGMKVWVYPGHQFLRCPCNVYVVEAGGMTVSHNGDMSAPHPWVMTLGRRHAIDLSFLNCWALPGFNARGQHARMTVIGHEYELGHDINGRRGVDETSRMLKASIPRVNLVWGESAECPPP